MKIEKIRLRKFRKFTDLTIQGLPESVKLVVLIGPNGSGKTSVLEGLQVYFYENTNLVGSDVRYYVKSDFHGSSGKNGIEIKFHGGDRYNSLRQSILNEPKAFYFRTAFRHEADFSTSEVGKLSSVHDDHHTPRKLNDTEARVSRNYQELVATAVRELFGEENTSKKVKDVREGLIGQVRSSMKRVFDDLILQGVGMPTEDGTFIFKRGESRDYKYANLSGGEKAAFDLLLDFIINKEYFDDTVYCIDEPELHMHTRLQGKLLGELYEVLPENCQLWVATHSVGMMRRATELHRVNPGAVAFLDFDSEVHNFDEPVVMEPTEPGRQLYKRVFAVALDDLADLVAPEKVIFCEGKPLHESSTDSPTFDAEVYRTIFQNTRPDTEFAPLGPATYVPKGSLLFGGIVQRFSKGVQIWSLIDKDKKTEEQVRALQLSGTSVLRYRELENYLWADEIIKKLCAQRGFPEKASALIEYKSEELRKLPSQKKASDDVKAIRDLLCTKFKKDLKFKNDLGLTQGGSTPEAFERQILAPLITPGTEVYKKLEEDIFGPFDRALEQTRDN